jgi:hypothetical protein
MENRNADWRDVALWLAGVIVFAAVLTYVIMNRTPLE